MPLDEDGRPGHPGPPATTSKTSHREAADHPQGSGVPRQRRDDMAEVALTPQQQLAVLRAEWKLWNSVRPDEKFDYRVLPFTDAELGGAAGDIVVAAYQVRERKLAAIKAAAAKVVAG